MVTPLHHYDTVARLAAVVEIAQCHLYRHLDSGRPTVGIEDMLQSEWSDFDQALRQPLSGLVRKFGEDYLIIGLSRGTDGRHDLRVSMAMSNDPPGRDCVEEVIAILIYEVGPICRRDARHRWLERMLGEGMPHG